jgi:hypothetical protein
MYDFLTKYTLEKLQKSRKNDIIFYFKKILQIRVYIKCFYDWLTKVFTSMTKKKKKLFFWFKKFLRLQRCIIIAIHLLLIWIETKRMIEIRILMLEQNI